MKRLPPSQVIAEYRAARERCGLHSLNVTYLNGWFLISNPFLTRYRSAQLIHMTATLNERAKAKG